MTTIREDDFSVALINTFYVKPEKADELIKLLTKATDEVDAPPARTYSADGPTKLRPSKDHPSRL